MALERTASAAAAAACWFACLVGIIIHEQHSVEVLEPLVQRLDGVPRLTTAIYMTG